MISTIPLSFSSSYLLCFEAVIFLQFLHTFLCVPKFFLLFYIKQKKSRRISSFFAKSFILHAEGESK